MSGPDLVFIGGWGYGSDALDALQACLHQQCTAWVAPVSDLGDGTAPGGEADLVAGLMRRMDSVSGPVVLAGWSLGGQVALSAAVQYPQRFRCLALIASTPRFLAGPGEPPGAPEAGLRALRRAVGRDAAAAVSSFRRQAAAPLEPGQTGSVPPVGALVQGLDALAVNDLRPAVFRLSIPLHLLHGDADAVVPVEASVWMARHASSAVLTRVAQAGHDLPVSDPERVARFLIALLERSA